MRSRNKCDRNGDEVEARNKYIENNIYIYV